jgi:hypothetical protein
MQTYVYDICANKECAAVFRCEHKDCTHCPKCNTSRFTEDKRVRKKLYYLPIGQWLVAAWANPDIARCVMLCPNMHLLKKIVSNSSYKILHLVDVVVCRGMRWSSERAEVFAMDAKMYRDHFDGSHWQDSFCKDPLISANGGPDKNVGLEFCADGVNPYKRKSYSMWFGALSIMNLPPTSRHSVDTMHLCFIAPGPHKPVNSLTCKLHLSLHAVATRTYVCILESHVYGVSLLCTSVLPKKKMWCIL